MVWQHHSQPTIPMTAKNHDFFAVIGMCQNWFSNDS